MRYLKTMVVYEVLVLAPTIMFWMAGYPFAKSWWMVNGAMLFANAVSGWKKECDE